MNNFQAAVGDDSDDTIGTIYAIFTKSSQQPSRERESNEYSLNTKHFGVVASKGSDDPYAYLSRYVTCMKYGTFGAILHA